MLESNSRRALICGVSGQDGAFLAHLLLKKGYKVYGTSRDAGANPFLGLQELGIASQLDLRSMSADNLSSVIEVFSDIKPHEVYNLAGQSSVGVSFARPNDTMASIVTGTLNQLEAIKELDKGIRYFNAGSGEVFGDTDGKCAHEGTSFRPQSPYAVAKAAATWLVGLYRQSYDLFACTGILFNHESHLRSERFVTKKIVNAAKRIADGSDEKLALGNIQIRRDWGWAPDYVVAMWKMLNQDKPEDYVIATGKSLSLEEFVASVFSQANLDWRDYVVIDPNLYRPSDPIYVVGNPEKSKKYLNWQPTLCGLDVPRKMFRETAKFN